MAYYCYRQLQHRFSQNQLIHVLNKLIKLYHIKNTDHVGMKKIKIEHRLGKGLGYLELESGDYESLD